MTELEKAILKTLVYSDIFDSSLTIDEIFHRLIGAPADKSIIAARILRMRCIKRNGKYYYLSDGSKTPDLRREKEKQALAKLKIAGKISGLLGKIPPVCFIGVSGGVAAGSARIGDDIDLLVVSEKGKLWLTRFLVTLFTEILGVRRKSGGKMTDNRICLNMYMEEDNLALPSCKRNLYSAYEIMHLKPQVDKKNIYKKLLRENSWIGKLLPNFYARYRGYFPEDDKEIPAPGLLVSGIERLFRKMQISYMSDKVTGEIIKPDLIMFHPEDVSGIVMKKYRLGLRKYNFSSKSPP